MVQWGGVEVEVGQGEFEQVGEIRVDKEGKRYERSKTCRSKEKKSARCTF